MKGFILNYLLSINHVFVKKVQFEVIFINIQNLFDDVFICKQSPKPQLLTCRRCQIEKIYSTFSKKKK